jgi:hypothetical protein
MDAKKTYLETQRATMLLVPKLFFLHTWLVHLVWIKVSLADIIGTDGLDEKNAETYFDNKPKVGARFITLNGGSSLYY